MASTFTWVIRPEGIGHEILSRAGRVRPGLRTLAQSHAARGEAYVKSTGAYHDRTGNLRQSSFGRAEDTTIYIGATMEYAPFVELGTSRMAARPFIRPAADRTANEYFGDAFAFVSGLF